MCICILYVYVSLYLYLYLYYSIVYTVILTFIYITFYKLLYILLCTHYILYSHYYIYTYNYIQPRDTARPFALLASLGDSLCVSVTACLLAYCCVCCISLPLLQAINQYTTALQKGLRTITAL